MVMGANIGTTVANTLVSLGHIRHSNEFRRAFAAATVHDFFNVSAVVLLLPLELIFGVISRTAQWLSERLVGASGSEWKSPVKLWVKEPVSWLESFWGAFGASGNLQGVLMVGTGPAVILGALTLITKNMRALVAARVERSLNALLSRGGGAVALLLGLAITIAVQSSSITTSTLIPLAGAGVIRLRNAYPAGVADDIRDTDRRINSAEQELRSELAVHVSVRGSADIGTVSGYTLLVKKIERIGDQAENILDLAEHGVSLASHPDADIDESATDIDD